MLRYHSGHLASGHAQRLIAFAHARISTQLFPYSLAAAQHQPSWLGLHAGRPASAHARILFPWPEYFSSGQRARSNTQLFCYSLAAGQHQPSYLGVHAGCPASAHARILFPILSLAHLQPRYCIGPAQSVRRACIACGWVRERCGAFCIHGIYFQDFLISQSILTYLSEILGTDQK